MIVIIIVAIADGRDHSIILVDGHDGVLFAKIFILELIEPRSHGIGGRSTR